jgi:hypothetical protein
MLELALEVLGNAPDRGLNVPRGNRTVRELRGGCYFGLESIYEEVICAR